MRESHCVFGSVFTVKQAAWSSCNLLPFSILDLVGEISRGLELKVKEKYNYVQEKNTLGDQI